MANQGADDPQDKKTLVRGADGALYLLTETQAPMKLTEEETQTVTNLLAETDEKLTRILKEIPRFSLGCTRKAHVTLPEVFIE